MFRALLVLLCVVLAFPALAQERVALIIGNADYAYAGQLDNPLNDATDIAAALERIDFDVTLLSDLGADEMRRALHTFSAIAANAEIAIIYFAGHGIEIDKQNYLIPVDARLATDRDINFEAVPLDLVSEAVSGARQLRMVLLDACRNNPFAPQMSMTKMSTAPSAAA